MAWWASQTIGDTVLHMDLNEPLLLQILTTPLRVDINARINDGNTALMCMLIRYRQSRDRQILKKAQILLEYGADPRVPDNNNNRALHMILDATTLMQILNSPFHVDINARNDRGETALHTAVISKSWDQVIFLLQNGIDFNIRDGLEQTADEIRPYDIPSATKTVFAYHRRLYREQVELAFCMGGHERLGASSWLRCIEPGILGMISEAMD
jgi:ankyrin repeat protein